MFAYIGPLGMILSGCMFFLVPFTLIECSKCGRKTQHYKIRIHRERQTIADRVWGPLPPVVSQVYKCDECGAKITVPASST